MAVEIRKSTLTDIPTLLHLAEEAKKTMRQSGNLTQWSDGYPSDEVFRNDIGKGVSYVIEENGVAVGTFAFVPGPDPTYAKIFDGQWADDTQPYYVIHRIASLPESHGTMAALLDFCFSRTRNIRIDTHRDNAIMRHLLKMHGFSYCGIIYLLNGDERLAFQKMI